MSTREEERLEAALKKRDQTGTSLNQAAFQGQFDQKKKDMIDNYQHTTGKPVNFTFTQLKPVEVVTTVTQPTIQQSNPTPKVFTLPPVQTQWTDSEPILQQSTTTSTPKVFTLPQVQTQWTETDSTSSQNQIYSAKEKSYGKCLGCLGDVGAAHVEALDGLWHSKCFVCTNCGIPLAEEEFIVKNKNQPWCRPCNINSAPTCPTCNLPVTGKILNALGKSWHSACFVCSKCGLLLDDYMEDKGRPVCYKRCPRQTSKK